MNNEIVNNIKKYKVSIVARQEVRWRQNKEVKKKNYTILYSGGKKQDRSGVAFILERRNANNLIEFEPVSGRLAYVRITGKHVNLSVININLCNLATMYIMVSTLCTKTNTRKLGRDLEVMREIKLITYW